MARIKITDIRTAIDTVNESQDLLIKLNVSIRSASYEHHCIGEGLDDYLKITKRSLYIQLMIGSLRGLFNVLSKTITGLSRVCWLWIINILF